ncbi:MAG TPA: DNA polymerase III subunit delta' [Rhizomicrobium sp.]|nr:DNA polymerase III subunit delta' [Rhizomicrobium sp.]
MAPRRPKAEEPLVEIDRVPGQPHPREEFRLVGQGEVLARAARAIRGGRPPQAWLIGGPPGIGKATLAYRIARYLLRYGATAEGPEDLRVAENDSVSVQVKAGAHPGLLVLKRGINPDTGKLMTILSVNEIRKLGNFFGLTSGAGGWRVAIVDTADDMNDAAANALLKLLEEPPPRAMLLLLAHAPARLLPTIRSRCQRLDVRPLDDATLDAELAARLPEMPPAERAHLAKLAGGSLGAALRFVDEEGLMLASEADKLIDRAASPDFAATLALAERIGRIDDGTEMFGRFLLESLSARIRDRARAGAAHLDRWIALWERLDKSFGRTEALHLEPRQTVLSAAEALAKTARRGTL